MHFTYMCGALRHLKNAELSYSNITTIHETVSEHQVHSIYFLPVTVVGLDAVTIRNQVSCTVCMSLLTYK
jgi:hypothetical protein